MRPSVSGSSRPFGRPASPPTGCATVRPPSTRPPGQPDGLTEVSDARFLAAELAGKVAEITVAFRSNFTTTDGTGREVSDHWTFARTLGAPDPNWPLVATAGEAA